MGVCLKAGFEQGFHASVDSIVRNVSRQLVSDLCQNLASNHQCDAPSRATGPDQEKGATQAKWRSLFRCWLA